MHPYLPGAFSCLRSSVGLLSEAAPTWLCRKNSCQDLAASSTTFFFSLYMQSYGPSSAYPNRPSPTTNLILPDSNQSACCFLTLRSESVTNSLICSMPTAFPSGPT